MGAGRADLLDLRHGHAVVDRTAAAGRKARRAGGARALPWERIADSPRELSDLLLALAERAVGDDRADLAEEIAREVESWIRDHMGVDYPWPGNVRELAQCVNNVLIRGEYRPAGDGGASGVRERLAEELLSGALTAEEILKRYCTIVYAQAGSYEEAARRLELDRRTVKSRVDRELLAQLAAI